MDPFKSKNPFGEMGNINHNPLSAEYLDQIKEMMEQYNSVLNEEFWNNIQGISNRGRKKMEGFPIELWESDEELFIQAYIPGVKDTRRIKVSFLSDKKLKIKATQKSEQPTTAKRQLASDFTDSHIERYVKLPYEVETDNYSIHTEAGIVTLIFNKIHRGVKVPFDF
ncbi:hypothetical protein ACFO3D_01385 [Virgibacillus kekensis]|uniref:SHSP domain-containing protein n=1 Tax=Virgibacillus kekensis TaxID=202261 RepID=A0ABV9DEN1_9BACI